MAAKALPEQSVLLQLLRYEPETGKLFWRERGVEWFEDSETRKAAHTAKIWNSRHAGKQAFTATTTGYCYGSVEGVNYLAHRIIFKMVHNVDAEYIDHISGDRTDNRLENLRIVSATENVRNSCIPSHNTSGIMGVRYECSRGKWESYITVSDQKVNLGRFHCFGEALKARRTAEIEHGFHANHGRPKQSQFEEISHGLRTPHSDCIRDPG